MGDRQPGHEPKTAQRSAQERERLPHSGSRRVGKKRGGGREGPRLPLAMSQERPCSLQTSLLGPAVTAPSVSS